MKRVALAFAIVLAVTACNVAGGRGDTDAANGGESAASVSPQPRPARPVWIDSLQMTSASSGWALIWTESPARSSALDVARTSDDGRTWDVVTPPIARAALSSGQGVLHVDSAREAWIVGVTSSSQSVVFGTGDGGRSWWRSGPVAGGQPVALAFAGARQGWLLESMGAAMSQNAVRLYRSSDAGRSWSLAASSAERPDNPQSDTGLPIACDKTGVAAGPAGPSAAAGLGWITGFCPGSLTGAVLVSRDGGAHWASPPLPIPPSACQQNGCEVAEPQVVGRTTFLVIWAYPDSAVLVVTADDGADWRSVVMPARAGPYPRVRFFGPADGIAVSAGSQGSIGRTFYVTFDGGRTWKPSVQGRRFGGNGASFDFVSPAIGFAWVTGAGPVTYQTSNSGRSWTSFVPGLS
jgi:photosystem II stability/assembly factor-like uncharacterized protein